MCLTMLFYNTNREVKKIQNNTYCQNKFHLIQLFYHLIFKKKAQTKGQVR